MQIAILYHPRKAECGPIAEEVSQWLAARGHETWIDHRWDEAEVKEQAQGSDLIIVLGGDGSILMAARLVMPNQTPIMGINMGRVGFLSEAEVGTWPKVLSTILEDDAWTESRMMLKASLYRKGIKIEEHAALNDFVISGQRSRVVRLDLRVDDVHITNYTADSLICSTPTGSTAYAMAAGGPLLPPQLNNFLLIPVAPYLSLDRALVLHEDAEVKIIINTDQVALLTADGQEVTELMLADEIVITKHDHVAKFIRVGQPGYFYGRLLKRLGFER